MLFRMAKKSRMAVHVQTMHMYNQLFARVNDHSPIVGKVIIDHYVIKSKIICKSRLYLLKAKLVLKKICVLEY